MYPNALPVLLRHEYAIYIWLRLFSAPKTQYHFCLLEIKVETISLRLALTLQLAISEVKLTSNRGDRAMHVDSRANLVRTHS